MWAASHFRSSSGSVSPVSPPWFLQRSRPRAQSDGRRARLKEHWYYSALLSPVIYHWTSAQEDSEQLSTCTQLQFIFTYSSYFQMIIVLLKCIYEENKTHLTQLHVRHTHLQNEFQKLGQYVMIMLISETWPAFSLKGYETHYFMFYFMNTPLSHNI